MATSHLPFRAERAWLEPDWASIQRANRAKFKRRRDLLLLLSRFSRVRLCATPYTAAYQAPHPWDSPGKNTEVGCHFLLQCMKVKSESESEVAQLCPTLSDLMDCSLPGSSIHGIFQARVLEWGAIAFSEETWGTSKDPAANSHTSPVRTGCFSPWRSSREHLDPDHPWEH